MQTYRQKTYRQTDSDLDRTTWDDERMHAPNVQIGVKDSTTQ